MCVSNGSIVLQFDGRRGGDIISDIIISDIITSITNKAASRFHEILR